MLQSIRSYRGMVAAPHHLASRAGLRVLEEGGNAIEAMVAAASTIAVVYPHMNSLGGDNFWLIHTPGNDVIGIDACGAAAEAATPESYKTKGFDRIPSRGALAALTVAGAVSGWQAALQVGKSEWGGRLPVGRLLEDATFFARDGIAVTRTQAGNTRLKLGQMEGVPGFAETYLVDGQSPKEGSRFRQPRLAQTLGDLAAGNLDAFYRGELARAVAADLERAGSPVRLVDLERHQAIVTTPLSLEVGGHRVFNLPPPTQGLASLIVLGIYDRLGIEEAETFEYVHGIVEASKRAFRVRDRYVGDPAYMDVEPTSFLTEEYLAGRAAEIDPQRALPWPDATPEGDTVWLGAIDGEGRAVSFIQSIYWEFGSGLVLDETGITWQNRGVSFSLDEAHHNVLRPFRRPFHTIQPAMAHLSDGRTMSYGSMGGDGQPQTQAALFTRYVLHGQGLQQAVTAPRWLLGRTWGAESTSLKIESRFSSGVIDRLIAAGHNVEVTGEFDEVMGHAGALVHHPDGLLEGAADPRSDGQAAGI